MVNCTFSLLLPADGCDIVASPMKDVAQIHLEWAESNESHKKPAEFQQVGLATLSPPFRHHPQQKLRRPTSVVAKS